VNTLILGIGNLILTDDRVGIIIARKIKEQFPHLDVVETSEAGIALLDLIIGYEKLIVIDSIKTAKGKPGEIYKFGLDDLKPGMDLSSSHGIDIATVFDIGKKMGYQIPRSVIIYAIEITDNTTFGKTCTLEIEKRIPVITREIMEEEKF
jgi:hydrogenase maturation protease